jgi:hypothetical protein
MSGWRAVAPGRRPVPRPTVLRGSVGGGLTDADLGWRGVDDQARPAGREARAGIGLAAVVSAAVDLDVAAGQAGQDGVTVRLGEGDGQAGDGRAGADGGDDRAAGGGERAARRGVSRLAWDASSVHPSVALSKLVGVGGGCHASDGAFWEAQHPSPGLPPHGCHAG